MKKKKFSIGLIIGIMIFIFLMAVLIRGAWIQDAKILKLNELEVRIDNLVENTVDTTVRTIVSDPDILFRLLDYSSQWEEVNAIPYSRCYRHLIGTSTISNYIMCKAI